MKQHQPTEDRCGGTLPRPSIALASSSRELRGCPPATCMLSGGGGRPMQDWCSRLLPATAILAACNENLAEALRSQVPRRLAALPRCPPAALHVIAACRVPGRDQIAASHQTTGPCFLRQTSLTASRTPAGHAMVRPHGGKHGAVMRVQKRVSCVRRGSRSANLITFRATAHA